MDTRTRYMKTLRYETVDHPPLDLPGPWPAARARWEKEGLPAGADLYEFFGLEKHPVRHIGIEPILFPHFEEEILEETGDYVVKINRRGVKERNYKNAQSMPEFLEYPIKGRESLSWLREKLDATNAERVNPGWVEEGMRLRAEGNRMMVHGGSYFAFLNEHLGTEELMYLYADDPDFVHEVNELQCRVCEMMLKKVIEAEFPVDHMGYHEDMAYKTGPLISPAMFREFMTPYYKRVSALASRAGIDMHFMDSDGCIHELIPLWLEVGINIMSPLEIAAGMDPVKLRATYGRDIAMVGGFDKRILAAGPEATRKELERLRPVVEEGGYIPNCDHGCPPDVPWSSIVAFVETLKSMYGMK